MALLTKRNDNLTAKTLAASKALSYIQNNMFVGLGTGSTANIFIDLLADKVRQEGLTLQCVATSNESTVRALENGLHVCADSQVEYIDVTIDGADEFDTQFRLIKGGGGALLREKIIARASKKFIVIADNSKAVEQIGKFPLPIECINYELKILFRHLEAVFNKHADSSAEPFIPECRKNKVNGNYFLTDLGHNIIDLKLIKIKDPECLARDLQDIAGIVDHGLFLNETSVILTDSYVLNKMLD